MLAKLARYHKRKKVCMKTQNKAMQDEQSEPNTAGAQTGALEGFRQNPTQVRSENNS